MTNTIRDVHGHHLYTPLLNADCVVIDLGACYGEFARELSERWGARAFAVEANPESFAKTYSGPRVSRHNVAIADRTGTARLYLGPNPEGNSLDPRHRDVSERYIEVRAMTLTDFMAEQGIRRLDVLKVDIEGAEVSLFRSIPDETLRQFTQVTVEFHDFIESLAIGDEVKAIKARMRRLGFWCFVYRRPNVDVLFLRRAETISRWPIRWDAFATATAFAARETWASLKRSIRLALERRRPPSRA